MIPWYWLLLAPAALVVGWVTPGVWRRLKENARGPIYQHLKDIKTQLELTLAKDEAAIKADVGKVIAKIEKVLP
jgi:hypothetical protein